MMRKIIGVIGVVGVIGVLSLLSAGSAYGAETEPAGGRDRASHSAPMNLLFIMADDLAEWAVGAYGNPEVITPNIDRLSRMGIKFRDAFVPTGICTASRAASLTGLFPPEVGVNDIISDIDGLNNGLPRGVQTWSMAVQQAGYRTAAIGKWHLGDDVAHAPRYFGFDYFFGYVHGDRVPWNPILVRDDSKHDYERKKYEGYVTDILTDDALAYLASNDSRPFALYMAYDAPHWPYGPTPKADSDPFVGRELTVPKSQEMDRDYLAESEWVEWDAARAMDDDYVRRRSAAYYAAVHSLDRNIGRLLDYLRDSGKLANTLVILTSDNGYYVGQRGWQSKSDGMPIRLTMQPLESISTYKNLYDRSLKVPFIVYDPVSRRSGEDARHLVSSLDVFPTILSALGVPVPSGALVRGQDLMPLVRGAESKWRDAVFGVYDSTFLNNLEFLRMIRTSRWKLIVRAFNPEGSELYDLASDPEELHNLYYARKPSADGVAYLKPTDLANEAIIKDLGGRLLEWRRSIGDVTLGLEEEYYQRGAEARRRLIERYSRPTTGAHVH